MLHLYIRRLVIAIGLLLVLAAALFSYVQMP